MRKLLLGAACIAALSIVAVRADNYTVTQGSGTTFGSKVVGASSINYAQGLLCDPTTPAQCIAVDASGRLTVLQGTSPWVVSNGGTFAVQATAAGVFTVNPSNAAAWSLGTFGAAQPTTGTALGAYDGTNLVRLKADETSGLWVQIKSPSPIGVNASQTGTWNIGTVTSVTNPVTVNPSNAAAWGLGTIGSATPATSIVNSVDVGGTLRSLNGISLGTTSRVAMVAIMDSSGNQVSSFGGSGGTASNFNSAFPSAGTAMGLSNGTSMIAWSANSNYGTAPSAIPVPAVNAFVTNATTSINNTSDGVAASSPAGSPVINYGYVFNGTSFDRMRSGSSTGSILVSNTTATNFAAIVSPGNSAAWGLGTFGSAGPASGIAIGGFNGTTLTGINLATRGSLQALSVQIVDSSGNQITSFGGSGGTALNDNSAFTQSTTSETPIGCLYNTGYANATSGRSTIARCTIDGNVYVNLGSIAGGALTASPTAYGTAPGAGNVIPVNAFVTNATTKINNTTDAVAPTSPAGNSTVNFNYVFDGTNWNRLRQATGITGALPVAGVIASGTALAGAPVRMGGSDGTNVRDISADSNGRLSLTAGADPCMAGVKSSTVIALGSTNVQLVAGSGSTQVYICSFSLVASAASVFTLNGGTAADCTTGNPSALLGSVTVASGLSLAANGGMTLGSGSGTIARTQTAGHGVCLHQQTAGTTLAGNITYIQQ